MPQGSRHKVIEFVRRVPDVRRDKVREMRSRIASGSWKPKSMRVAEKVLYEHLFNPKST